MSQFAVGDLLAEKYEIKAILGAGGMGTVYRARQVDLGRDVAIKVPLAQALEIPGFLARFSREAKLVARLVHDNIVQVYEYREDPEAVYIVMEYVEGQDLKTLVTRPPQGLKVKDIALILRAACDGLGHAHEFGIVHRDIKPHNIMVQQGSRGKWRVKIMDFGIAHLEESAQMTALGGEQLTATGQAIGTPSYMSPEQIRGRGVRAESDIYSFACVVYYCFTRQTPFQGTGFTVAASHLSDAPPSIRERAPILPSQLEDIVYRCLEKDPEKRYNDASELGSAIYDALAPIFDKPMSDIWPQVHQVPAGTDVIPPTKEVEASRSAKTMPSVTGLQPLSEGDPAKTISDTRHLSKPDAPPAPPPPPVPPVAATGTLQTNPSQLSKGTIPYEVPEAQRGGETAVPPPATTKPSPAGGLSNQKLLLYAGAAIVVLMIVGIGLGLAVRSLTGEKGGTTADPDPNGNNPDPNVVVQVDPTPVPDPDPLVTPEPTAVRPEPTAVPTEEPAIQTPTPIPTDSPTPEPTVDPLERRLETVEGFYRNATTLNDKAQIWREAAYDRQFGDNPRMQELAATMARGITLNPELQAVRGGRFSMGAPPDVGNPEERPVSNVTLDAYEIGSHEVTALEFATFLNAIDASEAEKLYPKNDRATVGFNAGTGRWAPAEGRELLPANYVSWNAAQRYTEWLTSESGARYRLPTEAEWEIAARAGTSILYPWGNQVPDRQRANFNAEREGLVTVLELTPGRNTWGLSHMAGNVAEWCLDWYVERAYEEPDRVNPSGPTTEPRGEIRPRKVLRGGSYLTPNGIDLRVTRRDRLEPDARQADVGFRIVKEVN